MDDSNGNSANGAVPNKVLAWSLVAISFVGAPFAMLWMLRQSDREHMAETLILRDRVHEAKQEALEAIIAGQDVVLQREMRLLVDALTERVDDNAREIERLRDGKNGGTQ